MIENHNFSEGAYELIQKTKSDGDKAIRDLMNLEIKAVKTYSEDFNCLFPAMSNVEFVYALVGAKKCVEIMLNTVFEHNPQFMIHAKFLEDAFDEIIKAESVMTNVSKLAEMMKGAGNDG